jgi:WD40 repeat protein
MVPAAHGFTTTDTSDGPFPAVLSAGNGKLRVLNPEDGSQVYELPGHPAAVLAVAVFESSLAQYDQLIVSVSRGHSDNAMLWDAGTGEWVASLGGHTLSVVSVAVWKGAGGENDRIATAGGKDGTIR